MHDCAADIVGKLGRPRSSGVLLTKRDGICYIALSFDNDRDATAFFFGEHHSAQEVAGALEKCAREIRAKDSGEMPLSPKMDFFFHHS